MVCKRIQCEFSYAGCNVEFIRDHQKEHMEQNTQKHLALVAAATLRISQTCEQKLQEKDAQVKKALKEQQEEFEKKFTEFQLQHDQQIKRLEEQQHSAINNLRMTVGVLPYVLTFRKYERGRVKTQFINIPSIYTHPGGYKLRLSLYPNGFADGTDTHVSIKVFSLKGDIDDKLKFPARFTITLELLNQHRDQDHYRTDIECEVTRKILDTFYAAGHSWKLISIADLEWNKEKQTQYLMYDCFKFRVLKISFT